MRYDVRKNWFATFSLMAKKPIVIMPFVFIAFLEALALELIYFSTRPPLSLVAVPIIRKFSGELFVHYPGILMKLPKLFYYAQVLIYIFAGVVLIAVSINIFRNIKAGLPVKVNVLVKNALKSYPSFLGYGIIYIFLISLLERADGFIFAKSVPLAAKFLPAALLKLVPFVFTLVLFISNLFMQIFLVLAVPIIVIKKRPLFKALAGSVRLAFRNFVPIFSLISMPFVLYLPIVMLKAAGLQLMDKTFPEIALVITAAGIILSIFVDSFIFLSASQFLIDKEGA